MVLVPAGILHRAGFGILALDLRNHGDSAVPDGRWAGGAENGRPTGRPTGKLNGNRSRHAHQKPKLYN